MNNIGKQYSLSYLLSQCEDFKNEKKDIEYLCKEMGINSLCCIGILFTPKFHCELAGEGIEYSWGAAKRFYRQVRRNTLSISKK